MGVFSSLNQLRAPHNVISIQLYHNFILFAIQKFQRVCKVSGTNFLPRIVVRGLRGIPNVYSSNGIGPVDLVPRHPICQNQDSQD